MSCTVRILRRAQKELTDIADTAYERIVVAIHSLADEPMPPGHVKLTGRDGYRIRVGDYRTIYEIDHQ